MNTDILRLTDTPIATVDLSKTNARVAAEQVINRVTEGDQYALETLAKLTFLGEILDTAMKAIRPMAVEEAEQYGKQPISVGGVGFQVKEACVKYDYSQDDEWQELKRQAEAAALMLRQCEERLRMAGECARTSTTTVSVTLPK